MSDRAAKFAERRKKLLGTSRVRMQRVTVGDSPVSKTDLIEAARKAEKEPETPLPAVVKAGIVGNSPVRGTTAEEEFDALDLAHRWTKELDLAFASAQKLSVSWAITLAAMVEVWGPQVRGVSEIVYAAWASSCRSLMKFKREVWLRL